MFKIKSRLPSLLRDPRFLYETLARAVVLLVILWQEHFFFFLKRGNLPTAKIFFRLGTLMTIYRALLG